MDKPNLKLPKPALYSTHVSKLYKGLGAGSSMVFFISVSDVVALKIVIDVLALNS